MKIGKILKTMRKKVNYTQDKVCDGICARNTLSQYENEIIQPDFNTIEKIANACGFDIFFVKRDDTKYVLTSKNIDREELY